MAHTKATQCKRVNSQESARPSRFNPYLHFCTDCCVCNSQTAMCEVAACLAITRPFGVVKISTQRARARVRVRARGGCCTHLVLARLMMACWYPRLPGSLSVSFHADELPCCPQEQFGLLHPPWSQLYNCLASLQATTTLMLAPLIHTVGWQASPRPDPGLLAHECVRWPQRLCAFCIFFFQECGSASSGPSTHGPDVCAGSPHSHTCGSVTENLFRHPWLARTCGHFTCGRL